MRCLEAQVDAQVAGWCSATQVVSQPFAARVLIATLTLCRPPRPPALPQFAGTRYLKRGVTDRGYVANDVEIEQVGPELTTNAVRASGRKGLACWLQGQEVVVFTCLLSAAVCLCWALTLAPAPTKRLCRADCGGGGGLEVGPAAAVQCGAGRFWVVQTHM